MTKLDRLHEKIENSITKALDLQLQNRRGNKSDQNIYDEALESLQLTCEELKVAEEELRQQTEELKNSRMLIEEERSRYLELFHFAPDAYMVTDQFGIIIEANQATGGLLNYPVFYLFQKPLAYWIDSSYKHEFRTKLNRLHEMERIAEWELLVRPKDKDPIPVATTVVKKLGEDKNGFELRWMMRDITERIRAEKAELLANLYQINIEKQEREWSDRARDLHDDILTQLLNVR